jgi:hypothetical protein
MEAVICSKLAFDISGIFVILIAAVRAVNEAIQTR